MHMSILSLWHVAMFSYVALYVLRAMTKELDNQVIGADCVYCDVLADIYPVVCLIIDCG